MTQPGSPSKLDTLLRLGRSGLAGLAATAADLVTLTLLVEAFHLHPRIANAPALFIGALVNFVGNRSYAFRARAGSAAKQALGYSVVEVVALGLNGLMYDLVLRLWPEARAHFGLVRLATSCAVFVCWSYPLWHRVFRVDPAAARDGRASA